MVVGGDVTQVPAVSCASQYRLSRVSGVEQAAETTKWDVLTQCAAVSVCTTLHIIICPVDMGEQLDNADGPSIWSSQTAQN